MEHDSKIKVSVIIRAYNSEATLSRAIRSALAQDLPRGSFEVIVVDDGSTDGTARLLERYASNPLVILAKQENRGISEAANSGIRIARGAYIIFLDADDELLPSSVSALSTVLDESSADYTYGEYFEEYGGVRTRVHPKDPFKAPIGAFAWRREKLLSEGGFAGDTIFPEYDILLRTWGLWKGVRISAPVFTYHRSKNSMTSDIPRVKDAIRLLNDKYPERSPQITLIRSYDI